MKAVFRIEYCTNVGESLHVVGDLSLDMTTSDGVVWCVESTIEKQQYRYTYEVHNICGDVVRSESFGAEHSIDGLEGVDSIVKFDTWCDQYILKPLRSSLFLDSLFRRKRPKAYNRIKHNVTIECYCERIEPHQQLAILGEGDALGTWSGERAVQMSDAAFPYWRVEMPKSAAGAEFKFVIIDKNCGEVTAWERGDNRTMPQYGAEMQIHSLSTPQFDTPLWRGQGVAIPIFALRTKRSWGVGEFADLRAMVDWSVERGLSIIQVLPINDTMMLGTWEDSYPYNANSNIALHPQYLSMRDVGRLKDDAKNRQYARKAKQLNALEQIDYEAVMELKMSYLRDIYKELGNSKTSEYKEFVAANEWWLRPYALYSCLRDKYSTPNFEEWGSESVYSEELCKKYEKKMLFYYFVQFHLHLQLSSAVEYARKHGVALKGDIPIGVSRLSVDAWVEPQLFNMGMQAGAPPDPFSNLGQNWGFPTYNWAEMSRDGYAWWRGRFQKMAEYFDAYRIDHILGFFRIWQIPNGCVHGLLGHFNPALPFSETDIWGSGIEFGEWQIKPHITDELLARRFSESEVEEVRREYLNTPEYGIYSFVECYDTQSKLLHADCGELKDRLIALHDEVLFVRDSVDSSKFHPRIMGHETFTFEKLEERQKHAFIALHDHFYYHRHNEFWRESAMTKLPVLVDSTNMLVCGEDLGMIPDSVAQVMSELQILTLEIERMPKQRGVEFGDVRNYPYLSVCTTSTHDMSTIRGWWQEESRDSMQRYFNGVLFEWGDAPIDCEPSMAQRIVERHVASPSMLTILPWQDWMAMDGELRRADAASERINVPAISRHYWRYRMHIEL